MTITVTIGKERYEVETNSTEDEHKKHKSKVKGLVHKALGH